MSWFIHLNFKHKLYNIEKLYLPPSILSVVNHKINRNDLWFCSFLQPKLELEMFLLSWATMEHVSRFFETLFCLHLKEKKEWKITGQTHLTSVIMQEILFFSPLHNVGIVTVRPTFQVTNSKHVHILFLCFYISLN